MDDDILELVGSVADFLDRRGEARAIAEGSINGSCADGERWRALCEMGLPVLCLPEPDGIGAGVLEATALAEKLGAVLLPEPAIATMVLAKAWSRHPESHGLLDPLCSGAQIIDFSGLGVAHLAPSGALHGRARISADTTVNAVGLLVADAYTSGAALVIADRANLDRTVSRSDLDPTRPSTIVELDGVEPVDILRLGDGVAEQIRRDLALLTAAELVGGMQRVLDGTREFVATRQQFGRAIGSFQAVKHRLADMYALTEQSRALVQFAAIESAAGELSATSIVQSAARWVPRSAIRVCEDAIHLHGAMGYSWEVDVHLHLRRALAAGAALESFDDRPVGQSQLEAEAV